MPKISRAHQYSNKRLKKKERMLIQLSEYKNATPELQFIFYDGVLTCHHIKQGVCYKAFNPWIRGVNILRKTEMIDLVETTTIPNTINPPSFIDLPDSITKSITPTTTSTRKEESSENEYQKKDVLPKSLDSYQNCVEVLKPLKDYINRIGNKEALIRLREVEKVVKYVIKNDKRPKKSLQNMNK